MRNIGHKWSDDYIKCIRCGKTKKRFSESFAYDTGYKCLVDSKDYLNLYRSDLIKYSCLKELVMLKGLDLSFNGLKEVSFLKELKQHKKLNLHLNKLTDLSFLESLIQLEDLNLGSNELTDVSFLKDLRQLKNLNLSSNKLTDEFIIIIK